MTVSLTGPPSHLTFGAAPHTWLALYPSQLVQAVFFNTGYTGYNQWGKSPLGRLTEVVQQYSLDTAEMSVGGQRPGARLRDRTADGLLWVAFGRCLMETMRNSVQISNVAETLTHFKHFGVAVHALLSLVQSSCSHLALTLTASFG